MESTIINALNWRSAVKKFDTSKKLTDSQLATILEAARLSPSSYGLQPWRFVVVTDPAVRMKLREASWGQAQVTDASHFIVLAAQTPDDALVDSYVANIAMSRGVNVDSLAGLAQMIKGMLAGMSAEQRLQWAQKQVYIALGVILTVAAMLGVDSCPMEGFDPAKYDEILNLPEQGLHATVVCALGSRAAEETTLSKIRLPMDVVVVNK
ncbi:MAG TPA: NAD(P)H-dependent oxidoreductase [Candidatus Paceibacterota bacterium]